jgi:hypothetical protein
MSKRPNKHKHVKKDACEAVARPHRQVLLQYLPNPAFKRPSTGHNLEYATLNGIRPLVKTNRPMLNLLFTKKPASSPCQPLKGAACLSGFKKSLFNRIHVNNYRLEPIYNRRKHGISHYILLNNQYAKLSKSFGYLSKRKIDFFIGKTLKKTYNSLTDFKSGRPMPYLVALVETDTAPVMYRNLFYGLAQAKHVLRHRWDQRNKFYVHLLKKHNNATSSQYTTKQVHNYNFKSHIEHMNNQWLHFGEIIRYYNPMLN